MENRTTKMAEIFTIRELSGGLAIIDDAEQIREWIDEPTPRKIENAKKRIAKLYNYPVQFVEI